MNNHMNKIWGALAVVAVIAAAVFVVSRSEEGGFPGIPNIPGIKNVGGLNDPGDKIEKFKSDDEFKSYIAHARDQQGYYGGMGMMKAMPSLAPRAMEDRVETLAMPVDDFGMMAEGSANQAMPAAPDRLSTTNVQVFGIDEPDIVKTDGREIYVSTPGGYYPMYFEGRPQAEPMMIQDAPVSSKIAPPYPDYPEYRLGGIKAVKAMPLEDMAVESTIEDMGDLLLAGDKLIALPGNKVVGYDVSDPKEPEKDWTIDVEQNTSIVAARLSEGKLYLVTQTGVWYDNNPCPIRPLAVDGEKISIPCTEVYHPVRPVPVDTTFAVMIVNPEDGTVEKQTAFIGSTGQSVVYMSPKAVYVTYNHQGDFIGYIVGFFKENKDIVPSSIVSRLEKLQGYDLSDSAKMTEFGIIMQQFEQSIEGDDRLKLENEFANRMESYQNVHKRDLEQTGIVKINASTLKVEGSGSIPGRLLNQFSMDEHDGYVRVATTVGESNFWWGFGFGGSRGSANDVYVLDSNLEVEGSVLDLGLTERVYSVRFIRDKGYVVTFRQTDPFYVLDLSKPSAPKMTGELKIPGYSSYLHPIAQNRILGVGQEGSQVKLSLFNVADPANPTEADKYLLNEYWSEVGSTHHAFLQDEKHKIFFMPGGSGGYIFSYADDKLSLTKAVAGISARRALFINDYLYVVGDDRIIVLDESSWERVKELSY